jgi:hypothetical protein
MSSALLSRCPWGRRVVEWWPVVPRLIVAAAVAVALCSAAVGQELPRPASGGAQEAWTAPVFPTPEPPARAEPTPAVAPSEGVIRRSGEDTWMDVSHEFVETRLFAPILRFDRFFSDNPGLDEDRARSFLRVRSELRYDREANPVFVTGLRSNLRLPGLHAAVRRMRVVLAAGAQEVFEALPGEPAREGRALGGGEAELRFSLFDAMKAHADLGAGLIFQWPVGVFTRAGTRWRLVAGELFAAELACSGFWRTDTGFGANASARLQRPLRPEAIVRLGNDFLISEVSEGVEWRPALEAIFGLGPRAAATLGVDAIWKSEIRPQVERYRVRARFRRDVYRRWIFVELEPELYWPWSPELGRHPVSAVTFRFEIQFNGNEPTPADGGPPRREPEDP